MKSRNSARPPKCVGSDLLGILPKNGKTCFLKHNTSWCIHPLGFPTPALEDLSHSTTCPGSNTFCIFRLPDTWSTVHLLYISPLWTATSRQVSWFWTAWFSGLSVHTSRHYIPTHWREIILQVFFVNQIHAIKACDRASFLLLGSPPGHKRHRSWQQGVEICAAHWWRYFLPSTSLKRCPYYSCTTKILWALLGFKVSGANYELLVISDGTNHSSAAQNSLLLQNLWNV